MDYARRKWWKLLPCTIVVLVVLIGAVEYGTSRPGFCGSCHIMNSYHESWAKSEHAKAGVACVACHYMPGEHHTLADCVGICYFWLGVKPHIPIREWDMAELFLLATGVNTDEDGVEKCVRRVRALNRAYNAILGERQKASDIPTKFFNDPAGILPPINRDDLSRVVAEANKAMGYTAEGIPTREALEEIDLGYVAEELERKGVLPQPVSV